ncbi:MAG: hypothetical protein ACXWZP_01645 [Gaiellaceae bacterium]
MARFGSEPWRSGAQLPVVSEDLVEPACGFALRRRIERRQPWDGRLHDRRHAAADREIR